MSDDNHSGGSRTAYYVAGGILALAAAAFMTLWYQPRDVLKHVAEVASAVARS